MRKICKSIVARINSFVEKIVERALSKRVDEILATKMPMIDEMIECAVSDYARENISDDAILSEIQGWVLVHAPRDCDWDSRLQEWIRDNAPDADEKFSEAVDGWVDDNSPHEDVFYEKISEWVDENSPCAETAFDRAIDKKANEKLESYDSIVSAFLSKLVSALDSAQKKHE